MPHTHYGPVMGVAPNPYNTRSKKRARHGESYAVGVPVDAYGWTQMGPQWVRYNTMVPSHHLPDNPFREFSWGYYVQYGVDDRHFLLGYRDDIVGIRADIRDIRTLNTVPLDIPEGRPVTQTGFRIELPDFLGDPSDPTSRYYNPRRQRRHWTQRPTDADDNPEYVERFWRVAAASQLREWSPR